MSYLANDTNIIAIKARIFDAATVLIDRRSAMIGGAWQGRSKDGQPRSWDPSIIKFFYDLTLEIKNPIILDVGANTGVYSLLPVLNPAIQCFAFEPSPEAFNLFKSNLALNKLENKVTAFPIALSDKAGTAELKIPASGTDSGLASLGAPIRFAEWNTVTVPTDTLNSVARNENIRHADLIKIDTEGCELLVLQGGDDFIREHKPSILLEYDERNTSQFGYRPEEIRALLESWGYAFHKIGRSDAFFHIEHQRPHQVPGLASEAAGVDIQHMERVPNHPTAEPSSQKAFSYDHINIKSHYNALLQKHPTQSTVKTFFNPEAIAINVARLAHLESLGLPLHGKDVLEVGSGVGMLTRFFEDKHCKVISSESRAGNIQDNIRLNPHRTGRVLQRDLNTPGSHDDVGSVDVVFCYGTLYHLSNPQVAIQDLARVTREFLLLETCVFQTDNGQINSQDEDHTSPNQANDGLGCRPARDWVFNELTKHFPYVYVTAAQPDHSDFPLAWPAIQAGRLQRCVFVASRRKLDSPLLLSDLPKEQSRFRIDADTSTKPDAVPISHTHENAGRLDSSRGKHGDMRSAFKHWIEVLAAMDRRLYYRDQSAESLASLAELARQHDPSVIVELGTLSGLSLRTWLQATSRARIQTVDLSFKTLKDTTRYLPADLSRVVLHEQNILSLDFHQLWDENDRVLLFVDAHDLPNASIMEYVLANALPHLPRGSLVVIDDLWHSPQRLTQDTAEAHFRELLLSEIDELQCFSGYFAPYHKGGSFLGFREVVPLLDFVNTRGIELEFSKGGKHVWFPWDSGKHASNSAGTASKGELECGVVEYHPLDIASDRPMTSRALSAVAPLYKQRKLTDAMALLQDLLTAEPSPEACLALSICYARLGRLEDAYELIKRGCTFGEENQRVERLAQDLERRLGISVLRKAGGTGLTLFALPKAFTGHSAVIQKNAVRSWSRLSPRPEIILFGDEPGIAEMAAEIGARHVPEIARNEFGTPLVNDIFRKAADLASNDMLAYVNADIILLDDFMSGVEKTRAARDEFLLVGRRWDLSVTEEIDFADSSWREALLEEVARNGFFHFETGLDYFVHTKGFWIGMPPFALGRCAWDNWLMKQPLEMGKAVIDASEYIKAIHQDHDYGHVAGGRATAFKGQEAERNKALAGPSIEVGFTTGATLALKSDGQVVDRVPLPVSFNNPEAKQARLHWLLIQADRLTRKGRMDLAAARYEEALPLIL